MILNFLYTEIEKDNNSKVAHILSPVAISLEEEPKLKYAVLKLALITVLVVRLPLSIDDFKRNVLVWWTALEVKNGKVGIVTFGQLKRR